MQNTGDWYSRFSSLEIISAHSHGYHHYIEKYVEKEILFPLHLSMWFKKYSSVTCAKVRYLVYSFCFLIIFFVTLNSSKMVILTF